MTDLVANREWLLNRTQPGAASLLQLLRFVLDRQAVGEARWSKVLPYAVEAHGRALLPDLEQYLQGGAARSQSIVLAAGATQQQALVSSLIACALDWEATGDLPLLYQAVRGLGYIGGREARHFLINACRRFLPTRGVEPLMATVEALALLADTQCASILYDVLRDMDNLLAYNEQSIQIRATATLGLVRLGVSDGVEAASRYIRGEDGEAIRGMIIRLLVRTAPDLYVLLPALCESVLNSPLPQLGLVLRALELQLGRAPAYEPYPSAITPADMRGTRIPFDALWVRTGRVSSREAIVRRSLVIGLTERAVEALEVLLDEARTNVYGLGRYARHVLAYGPLACSTEARMLFSREQHQSSGTRADMVSSIEADAVLARAQNATALARCVGFIEAVVGWHGVLLRSATEAAAASHDSTIPRHLPSILFTLPQQQLAIEALDEASVQRCRHTLWALLLTSRRDIRIRCIEALVRGGGDEELAWLRMHRTQEPCPSVLAAIPE